MKDNTLIIFSIILTIVCLFAIYGIRNYGSTPIEPVKNDTIIQRDTTFIPIEIKDTVPKLVFKEILKTDTFYTADHQPITLNTERKIYKDTLVCNEEDSVMLESYISGVNPTLDSISIKLNRREITNTVLIEKQIQKKKTFFDRVHIGAQVGTGYGLFNKKPDIYVGLGLSLDL